MRVSDQRRDFFIKKKINSYSIFENQTLDINKVINSKTRGRELRSTAGYYKSNSYNLLNIINNKSNTSLLNNPKFLDIKNGDDKNGHHIIFKRLFNKLNNS